MRTKITVMMRTALLITCAMALVALVLEVAHAQSTTVQGVNGKIAFAGRRSHNNYEIYTVNPDGSAVVRITNTTKDNFSPAWSPDGKKIAFASRRDSLSLEIYVMNADGSNVTRLTNNNAVEDFEPAWSPDGRKIAFTAVYTSGILHDDLPGPPPNPSASSGSDIFVMNADGSQLVKLTNGNGTANWGASWSPDSTRIAFTSNRDGNSEIYVMNADGTGQTRITNHPARDFDPAWSPNSARIVFASSRSENHCCGITSNDEIYTMNTNGTGIVRLTNGPNFHNQSPVWSPDGTRIAFQRYIVNGIAPDSWHIYQMSSTDGSNLRGVTYSFGGTDIQADWQSLSQGSTEASGWIPATPGTYQVELQPSTTDGKTSVKVILTFNDAGYRVVDWGQVNRSGNDFTVDANVERWTEGSAQVVTTVTHIYELGSLEPGDYSFTFKSFGTTLKTTLFNVGSGTQSNPIDNTQFFVRYHYLDFLNREPDAPGLAFWTDNILKCNDPARRPANQTAEQCIDKQRVTTSGAFFMSPEFLQTGYYVYRLYKGSLGRAPSVAEFTYDRAIVSNQIVVNDQLSGAKINENKRALAQEFVQRATFLVIYGSLSNAQYVAKLFETTGVAASDADKQALVDGLDSGSETRASVLQKVVDGILVISEGNQQFTTAYGRAFYEKEFNNAFVQMEYFGYMRRDPDAAGYDHWLGKLNFYGNYIDAEMVRSFIVSPEYRARFGQP